MRQPFGINILNGHADAPRHRDRRVTGSHQTAIGADSAGHGGHMANRTCWWVTVSSSAAMMLTAGHPHCE